MPLVTLIADHEPGPQAPSLTPAAVPGTRPASMPVPAGARKETTRARLLFIAAITAGCTGSILWHDPLLPVVLVTGGSLAGDSLRARLPAGRRHAPRT